MNRVAVVTGAARGIGEAIALRLARDGFDLAVVDLDGDSATAAAAAIRAAGCRAERFVVDVSAEQEVASAVVEIASSLGPPTVLVNNAGVTRDNLVFKATLSDWETVMSVHLRGAFLMTRAVQAYMVEQRWGRVVNLSSTSALGNRGQSNYSAAKAGIQGFTKTLALELGKFGVTANCVAPGFIVSDMTRATAARLDLDWETYLARRTAEIPVARAGSVDDVAHTVSFLASPGAGFVTGQVIYVAGGPRG